MAVAVTDVNKSVVMQMLRTDVFGFSTEDIEAKAQEVHSLVVNGDETPKLKMVGGYGRTETGNIAVFYNGFFHAPKQEEKPAKGKKK
jgi:hypothetical protein